MRRSASDSSEGRIEVTDYLLLLRSKPELPEEAVYEALSRLLSLMFAVPNTIVATTGPIRRCHVHSSVAAQLPAADGQVLTQAVHFRFPERCALQLE